MDPLSMKNILSFGILMLELFLKYCIFTIYHLTSTLLMLSGLLTTKYAIRVLNVLLQKYETIYC